MTSKTIILSADGTDGRGILTISFDGELLQCRLRLYNISPLNAFCKLGIYHQEQVYSANLLHKNGAYTTSLVGDFDINKDFYAAIIDTSNNNSVVLAGGSYLGYFSSNNDVFSGLENDSFGSGTQEDKPTFDENLFMPLDDEVRAKNEHAELSEFDVDEKICPQCERCKYKEYFYSNNQPGTNENLQVETSSSNAFKAEQTESAGEKQLSLLESILPQFDYIFAHYDEDKLLESLVENSKFARVSEGKDNYSIGTIYADGKVKYLCYAVKANYNDPVPSELGTHYQWLPIDQSDPLSDGYYLVFQDANNLSIVK